jgi:hypothetical protein
MPPRPRPVPEAAPAASGPAGVSRTAFRFWRCAGFVVLSLWLAMAATLVPAQAQGTGSSPEVQGPSPGIAFDEWDRVARRAEVALQEDRASNAALESLRVDLVAWRARLELVRSGGDNRIATLRAQIAALGPAPEDPTADAPEIATRRAELNRQLARLDAPRLTADEAYSRADSLIREIDTRIRERQADELLQL